MNSLKYALKSWLHYWKLNLTIVLGVALSAAILFGAFIIGDTVKYSLQQITLQRLGETNWVVTGGERLFRADLASEIVTESNEATSILFANGMAVLNGGQARAGQLQVWGVENGFNGFVGVDSLYTFNGNEAVINAQLAEVLGVNLGEEILLRVNKQSTFPANTPFVSADESMVSFRVKVKAIAGQNETGNFNLQNIQSVPKNVFLSLDFLNRQMDLNERANVILVNAGEMQEKDLYERISVHWKLEDLNLAIRENVALDYTELISDRVFVEPSILDKIVHREEKAYPVFSYFVNKFQLGDRQTPYSFVTGLPGQIAAIGDGEMIINQWLAEDLQTELGDSISVTYFEVGPLRQLKKKTARFQISGVVEMEGQWADLNLMPDIPGLSDAGHCSDWETGVPIDLSDIRQKDEDYWNKYKGTPKAFVSLKTAQELWGNRFGKATAIRVNHSDEADLEKLVLSTLQPQDIGFQVKDAKANGLQAASQGSDFSGLFIGLSFFVLFAALLLAYLMFELYLNFRRREIGTLHAMGFSPSRIQQFFFSEALFIVFTGIILGLPLGLAYNSLIMDAINSIWRDIVRTSILHVLVRPMAALQTILIVLVISLTTVWFVLRRFAKQAIVSVQQQQVPKSKSGKRSFWIGISLVVLSVMLMLWQGIGQELNAEIFFISGFVLLPGLILLVNNWFIRNETDASSKLSANYISYKLILANCRRNMLIISFLSIGVFLVLSTGLNRKDLTSHADQASSGTGGYAFFAQTSYPVLYDLNAAEGRFELGFEESPAQFVQFQALPGDDASCLNLNRVKRPRILGFDVTKFDQRQAFTFATKSDELDAEHPWMTLEKPLENGQIPAVADQTVIKWGLGKSVGDTLVYQNEAGKQIVLKLVGGLANSVFQGNILIADSLFYGNFPSVSGSQVFLVDAPISEEESLRSAFRNYGLEILTTKERLLLFYQVENTYLNIFLLLGALGLLIGTAGLGIIIFRSIYESRTQFALLEATGFRKQNIRQLVLRGHLLLVLVSLVLGVIPAILSALPRLLSALYVGLLYWSLLIFVIVLLSGWLWVFIGNRLAMRGNLYQSLRNE
ncbi:ABC transporter permease [uncultured Sunxiuqinia sp.]|uniref:ABC transporter permease n=1 Tax=uncultured Sunxiuqinia sp. TaxID=1573825 RepID=UPI002AA815EB|nr:ABC transporter permease [uncultured Sunxiuqinia sp.]